MGRAISANLAPLLDKGLNPGHLAFLRKASQISDQAGLPLLLVGGPVRDLLLNRPVIDLDLLVEGDASSLASTLGQKIGGAVVARSQFGTAKLEIDGLMVDLTTARRETYSRPGALPIVARGSIEEDLSRRDFTINAMAVDLSPAVWGRLWDLHGGMRDVEKRLVRVLHSGSFQDDATRMLRAVRYEQRLSFQIEQGTLRLLEDSLKYLDTISGDRLRHELERIFLEERPSAILARAQVLGALSAIFPGLERGQYQTLEEVVPGENGEEHKLIYVSLLAHRLERDELPAFVDRLNMPSSWAKAARDTVEVREMTPDLARAGISPSQVYNLLEGRSPEVLKVCIAIASAPLARERLELYLDKWRYAKPSLDGEALLSLGVPQGPMVGILLKELRRARLDGEVFTLAQETKLVKEWLV